MMRDSLNAATRAIRGTRGEAINVTLTSGHGTKNKDLVESMDRAWVRHHAVVLKQHHDILKSAVAIDKTKRWTQPVEDEYYEPEDDNFPDVRSIFDPLDPACVEMNEVLAKRNAPNLKSLVEDYTSLLSAGCGANQEDPVWELEADIRRVQALIDTQTHSMQCRRNWTRQMESAPGSYGDIAGFARRRTRTAHDEFEWFSR